MITSCVDALLEGERITYEALPSQALRHALIRFSCSFNADSTPGHRSEARRMPSWAICTYFSISCFGFSFRTSGYDKAYRAVLSSMKRV